MRQEPIVELYSGGRDEYGRSLDDIWAYSHDELEEHHDFIQYLFPSDQPSMFQDAPLVTNETRAAFAADPAMRANLLRSVLVMLDFYGLHHTDGMNCIEPAENFPVRSRNWLTPHNHNFLRLSRILRSLTLLGLPEHARALLACLKELAQQQPTVVGDSLGHWQNAVKV